MTEILDVTEERVKRMREFLDTIKDKYVEKKPWEFTLEEFAETIGLSTKHARVELKRKLNDGTITTRIWKQNNKFYSLVEKE